MGVKVPFLCLLLLFTNGCQKTDYMSISNMNISETPTANEQDELIKLLESSDIKLRQHSAEQLVVVGRQSEIVRNDISHKLIEQGKTICTDKDGFSHSETSFDKLRLISDILAEMESIEALDMLINCSDYVDDIGGFSLYHSATMPALLKYKEKAKPILIEKWNTSNDEVKCNIANALTETGGVEVKDFLEKKVKHESNKEVLQCLGINLNYLNKK